MGAGVPPSRASRICLAMKRAAERSLVGAAAWGVTLTAGCDQYGLSAANGSSRNTSSAAASIFAGIQRRDQICIDHSSATPAIDQKRAIRQLRQRSCIDQVGCCRRQRQQVHQHVGARQQLRKRIVAAEASDALNLLGRAAPPHDVEVKIPSIVHRSRARSGQGPVPRRTVRCFQDSDGAAIFSRPHKACSGCSTGGSAKPSG